MILKFTFSIFLLLLLTSCVNFQKLNDADLCFASIDSNDAGMTFDFRTESVFYSKMYDELKKRDLYLDKCVCLMLQSAKTNQPTSSTLDTQWGSFEPRANPYRDFFVGWDDKDRFSMMSLIYYSQRNKLGCF